MLFGAFKHKKEVSGHGVSQGQGTRTQVAGGLRVVGVTLFVTSQSERAIRVFLVGKVHLTARHITRRRCVRENAILCVAASLRHGSTLSGPVLFRCPAPRPRASRRKLSKKALDTLCTRYEKVPNKINRIPRLVRHMRDP